MKIERNISKDSWKIGLPSEMMYELGWLKGDCIVIELVDNKLVLSNKEERTKQKVKVDKSKRYLNGKKVPSKKTPCEFYEFTKQKYVDNKCKSCDKSEMFFKNGVKCPLAEESLKEVTREISKNLNNESKITNPNFISDNELKEKKQKLKELKQEYEELAKTEILILNSLDENEKLEYIRQVECGICGNPILENSNIIINNRLICKDCKKEVISQIMKTSQLKKEIENLERELKINGRH